MIIDELSQYFIDENKIRFSTNILIINTHTDSNKSKSPVIINKPNNIYFYPKEPDKLFWIFFIIKNGEIEYEMSNSNNFLNEKNTKIDYITKIRSCKDFIKQHKITSLSELENNLSNESKLSIETFFILCAIENINVVYLWKNCYYKLFSNDDKEVYLIEGNNNKFGFFKSTKEFFNEKISNKFEIISLSKPLKSCSFYKVDDLKSMLTQLDIDIDVKSNKNNLYEKLIQYFSNFKKN
jgi:hypothetical protein